MVIRNAPNERWSVDFVSDQLANGRGFRVFNVGEDYRREAIPQVVDFSISGARLAREPDQLAQRRPLPARSVMDNGPLSSTMRKQRWNSEAASGLMRSVSRSLNIWPVGRIARLRPEERGFNPRPRQPSNW